MGLLAWIRKRKAERATKLAEEIADFNRRRCKKCGMGPWLGGIGLYGPPMQSVDYVGPNKDAHHPEEYMRITCQRCGHWWREPTGEET